MLKNSPIFDAVLTKLMGFFAVPLCIAEWRRCIHDVVIDSAELPLKRHADSHGMN